MSARDGNGIALLADVTRRRIVAVLALRPCRSSTIAREIGLSRPATSRQLRILREAGLVARVPSRIDGRSWVYRLDGRAAGRITVWLAGTEIGLEGRTPRADQ